MKQQQDVSSIVCSLDITQQSLLMVQQVRYACMYVCMYVHMYVCMYVQ